MCLQKSYGDQGLWELFILKAEMTGFIQKVFLKQTVLILYSVHLSFAAIPASAHATFPSEMREETI